AVLDGRHPVNGLGRDVHALTGLHLAGLELAVLLNFEEELSRLQVDGLVLHVVVLEAQRVPGVDVDDLPHVAIGLRPMQLVAPRLFHSSYLAAHGCAPFLVPGAWSLVRPWSLVCPVSTN